MKKVFITLAVVLGMATAANAQLVIGGGIGFGANTNGGSQKDSEIGLISKAPVDFTFGFTPRVGYIFNEKWEVGGKLALNYNQTMTYDVLQDKEGKNGKAFKEHKDSKFVWAIQPYARFRCFEINGFGLWIEGVASVGTSLGYNTKYYAYEYNSDNVGRTADQAKALNEISNPRQSAFQGSLAFQPVLTYAINEHWIIETSLNFLGFNLGGEVATVKQDVPAPTATDPNATKTVKTTTNTFKFDLNANTDNVAMLGFLQIGASYKF
ncbi:MAG: hypothetical protein II502_05690 [Paludibacteraceae bacterium]|nr:hypothetical protein [Paludibacteraceae bacterium]